MVKNGGEVLAELLSNYGVRFVFGVPGGQTLSFYDGIEKLQPKIRHVLVRDEKTSPLMAIGYSKVTFRPGVVDGTAGPGAANMLPSVIEAWSSSTPLIVLTSNIVTKWMGKGASQELDHFALFRSFVKTSLRPRNTPEIPSIVRKAFRLATSGRPGPVHVDLPQDILEGQATEAKDVSGLGTDSIYSQYPPHRPRPDFLDVTRAVEMINQADFPVVLAGGGAVMSHAFDSVLHFAELIGAPVVTTLTAKGIIPEDNPLSLGCVGRQGYRPTANKALKEADLVIALGTKFAQVSMNNWTLIDETRAKIIHIDLDPTEFGKNYWTDLAIQADIKSALDDISNALRTSNDTSSLSKRTSRIQKVATFRKEWDSLFEKLSSDSTSPLKAAFVMKEVQRALPSDSILVSSGSFSGSFAGAFYNVLSGGNVLRFIQARGMAGTEGALPLAIGAALGVEGKSTKVLAVTGDGGFGYHVAELETARRMNLALPIVVLNNNSLAWMKLIQEEKFGARYLSSNYSADLSYAKIAESFGCEGIRVEKASELTPALGEAVKSDSVTVVEVMTDPKDCSSTHMSGDLLTKEEGVSSY